MTAGWGANVKNAYFLKFISAATGGSVINFSDRFTLSSMTGTFPNSVQIGLRTISGTDGPEDINNIQSAQVNPDAAVSSAGDAQYDTPYTLQSGSIRYAPMPPVAPSKITAKNPSAQYPTSAYTVYKTVAGPPNAQTTITNMQTFTVQSKEPTVSYQVTLFYVTFWCKC